MRISINLEVAAVRMETATKTTFTWSMKTSSCSSQIVALDLFARKMKFARETHAIVKTALAV